jgi:hypothetical protein
VVVSAPSSSSSSSATTSTTSSPVTTSNPVTTTPLVTQPSNQVRSELLDTGSGKNPVTLLSSDAWSSFNADMNLPAMLPKTGAESLNISVIILSLLSYLWLFAVVKN